MLHILPWSTIRIILSVVFNKISDALPCLRWQVRFARCRLWVQSEFSHRCYSVQLITRRCFYSVYSIDVAIRQQECDLLKCVFVHYYRLVDELNISSKTGMLCFTVLTQYSWFLHCALASGTVYCNRSCMCVCGKRAGWRCPSLTTASTRSVCVSLSAYFI